MKVPIFRKSDISERLRQKHKEEFEIREKRINLVFKVLYVLSAIWAFVLSSYVSNLQIDTAPMFCWLLAVLTTLLVNIISFIIKELRCLRISSSAEIQVQNLADEKYSEIWEMIGLSAFFATIFFILNIYLQHVLNLTVLAGTIVVLIAVEGLSYLINIDRKRLSAIIHNIAVPLMCYAFFAIPQIKLLS